MVKLNRRTLLVSAAALAATGTFSGAALADGEVTISHYFTGELGLKGIQDAFAKFTAAKGIAVKDSPIGHEDFKTGILVRAAGNRAVLRHGKRERIAVSEVPVEERAPILKRYLDQAPGHTGELG